jgi:hypothetical protein
MACEYDNFAVATLHAKVEGSTKPDRRQGPAIYQRGRSMKHQRFGKSPVSMCAIQIRIYLFEKGDVVISPTEEQELKSAAYHEAGHALVVISLGYSVVCASITLGDGHNGYVRHTCQPGTLEHIMVSLAGAICLDVFKIPSDEYGGAGLDTVDHINDVAALIPDDGIEPLDQLDEKRERVFRRLQSETERILRRRPVKKAIKLLAMKLLENRTMDGADIHSLIEPSLASVKDRPLSKG